ncbi:MAG: divalent-cation tolerance protein CutA [Polyangia bacterium]
MPTVLALTSCPDAEVAGRISRVLVEERLAACVTQLPGARSVFRWEGTVQEAEEVVCLIKTTTERLPDLRHRLPLLHPYALPELVVLDVRDGLPAYLAWIATETT